MMKSTSHRLYRMPFAPSQNWTWTLFLISFLGGMVFMGNRPIGENKALWSDFYGFPPKPPASVFTETIAKRLVAKMKSTSSLTIAELHRCDKTNHRIQLITAIIYHFLIVVALLACGTLDLYLLQELLASPFIDAKSWGFRQVVGMTIWMGVILELAYLEWS